MPEVRFPDEGCGGASRLGNTDPIWGPQNGSFFLEGKFPPIISGEIQLGEILKLGQIDIIPTSFFWPRFHLESKFQNLKNCFIISIDRYIISFHSNKHVHMLFFSLSHCIPRNWSSFPYNAAWPKASAEVPKTVAFRACRATSQGPRVWDARMSQEFSMASKWVIIYLWMGCIRVITHVLTFD